MGEPLLSLFHAYVDLFFPLGLAYASCPFQAHLYS